MFRLASQLYMIREASVRCKPGGDRSVSHGGVMDGERAGVAIGNTSGSHAWNGSSVFGNHGTGIYQQFKLNKLVVVATSS